jgi:hypothetical protein
VRVSQNSDEICYHPSVLTAALTFFLGLVVVPWILFPFVPHVATLSTGYNETLRNLQILTGITTIVYVILRRTEGDFRALFLISTALFVLSEGLNAISRKLSSQALSPLEIQFTTTMLVYGSLGLTAAIAEGRQSDWYHRALVAAITGFIAVAGLKIYFEMRGAAYGARERFALLIVTSLVALHVGIVLLLAELGSRRRRPVAKIIPVRADSVSAGNGHDPHEPNN